jgi:hypothetical protein
MEKHTGFYGWNSSALWKGTHCVMVGAVLLCGGAHCAMDGVVVLCGGADAVLWME